MIITKLKGIHFNAYGNTEDNLPKEWVNIEYDGRRKNHTKFLKSKHTRIIKKLEGWGGTKKWRKPIISYWTDTPEIVEMIIKYGFASNSIDFITREDKDE